MAAPASRASATGAFGFGAVAIHVGEVPAACGGRGAVSGAPSARRGAPPAQKRRYARGMELVEQRLDGRRRELPGRARRGVPRDAGRRRQARAAAAHAALRAPRRDARRAACSRGATAVELLHMATLVHDDVLDRAELRRGRPTVAHEFGVETAVSAGNYLLARAFRSSRAPATPPPSTSLSAAAVGLSEGEVLQRDDAHRRRSRRRSTSAAASARPPTCSRPPAGSARCCRAPGRRPPRPSPSTAASSASPSRCSTTSSTAAATRPSTGKRPGTDVRDGTVTLPLIFALEAEPGLGELLARDDLSADEVATVLRDGRRQRRPRACPGGRFGVH